MSFGFFQWVQDGSPSHSTPIKVESPNQFVPLGTSKKEFKKIQQAMKEGRRAGGITAGPESKVLEGATWEEANRDMTDGPRPFSGMDNNVDYKVGAASKGIIQRDYQHHATVYKSAYSRNPFDNVSADELAEYRRIIDSKSRAEGGYISAFFCTFLSSTHLCYIFDLETWFLWLHIVKV